MKLAAAMKYGGELVNAEECDYDSFKQLVPLCPNCKEPVFLRVGSDRLSVKGKEFKIGPHWCHFKGISAEQVASCESRVSGYTENDRQRIAAQARGQRLKLLQRWFWSVYTDSFYSFLGKDSAHISQYPNVESLRSDIGILSRRHSESMLNPNNPPFLDRTVLNRAAAKIVQLSEDLSSFDSYISGYVASVSAAMSRSLFVDYAMQNAMDSLTKAFFTRPRSVDSDLQQKIIPEVVGFLTAKRQQSLLTSIALMHCWFNSKAAESMANANAKNELALAIALMVVQQIVFTPWAAEFQRLEDESRQQKRSA